MLSVHFQIWQVLTSLLFLVCMRINLNNNIVIINYSDDDA